MKCYYGKYMGFALDTNDPKMRGRLRAEVPAVFGPGVRSNWCEPCFSADHFFVPEEGDGVWVEFEGGDPGRPIWSGVWFKGAGSTTTAPFQEVHAAMLDYEGQEAEPDKADHADPDTVDDEEHREYHDHRTGQYYTPHVFGIESHSGHTLILNDHPGRDALVRLSDRFGRLLELTARGVSRLRGIAVSAASGLWQDLEGVDVAAEHALVFEDAESESEEQYAELHDMAGARLRLNSTPGGEYVLIEDFWGQQVKINSVAGEESVEVLDKAGQRLTLDAVGGTITVEDAAGNTIVLEDGKITLTSVGDIHLDLATGGSLTVSGEALATESHVDNVFKTHIHPTSMGPSGTPVPNAVTNLWPQVTKSKT